MKGNERTTGGLRIRSLLSAFAWLLAAAMPVFAAVETDLSKGGISLSVTASPDSVDVARDFEVVVRAVAPEGVSVALPDLRDRFRGFSVAEDFAEEPFTGADSNTTYVSSWRLVPKPCEKVYKLLPFVVTLVRKVDGAEVRDSFYTSPVYFRNPAVRQPVTGGIEVDPEKDLPPLSWKLVRYCLSALLAACAVFAAIVWVVKKIAQKVREHRMSPIERAMLELDRLLQKGLPGRGRYKDFYVELTMVVRRYIQRRHSVRAPNLTTGEFLRAAAENPAFTREALEGLRQFLESSDMVKFAGVEATPEMADSATDRARDYLNADSRNNRQGGGNQ
jgi:hypothetical protein